MDCFPCSVAKRRVELELANRGVESAHIANRVAVVKCAMCLEADRQEATRAARAARAHD